jgi:hypothetical protein
MRLKPSPFRIFTAGVAVFTAAALFLFLRDRISPIFAVAKIERSISAWTTFNNGQEGFSIKLPAELVRTQQGRRAPNPGSLDPYEFTVFSLLKLPGERVEPFQVFISSYLNSKGYTAAEYAQKRDESRRKTAESMEIISREDVLINGIWGVRSSARLKLSDRTWQTWSRVILPYKDKLYIISGLIGRRKPVSEYNAVFDSAVKSFKANGV